MGFRGEGQIDPPPAYPGFQVPQRAEIGLIYFFLGLGMITFSFLEKRLFRYENVGEKSKTKRSFLGT